MLWIFGKRYAGKVDYAPGLFFVKSVFLHVYWLPIVPQASYLFWDDPQDRFRGVRIPFCWRSVFKAWLWLYPFFLFLLVSAVFTFVNFDPPTPQNLPIRRIVGVPILVVVVLLPVLLWFKLSKLTPDRALELGRILSIPEMLVEQHMQGNRAAFSQWLETHAGDGTIARMELPTDTPTMSDTAIREAQSRGVYKR